MPLTTPFGRLFVVITSAAAVMVTLRFAEALCVGFVESVTEIFTL